MSAPDLIEPIIGFRAWWPERDGRLWSISAAGAWDVGVTTARCERGSGTEHAAPGHDCSCGLYALTDHRDWRLICDQQAVGAVVAWGEMEVHRTGFRAQHACVVALALPDECRRTHRASLAAAALRYRVPLVPPDQLLAIALEHGQRLPFGALSDPPAGPPRPEVADAPALLPGGPLGTAVDEHLHLRLDEDRVWVELTPALAAELPAGAELRPMTTPGTAVSRGDVLATMGVAGDKVVLRSPISALPGLATGVSAAEWRMSLVPTRWDDEARDLGWGEPGLRHYAALLAEERRRGDPFASIRSRWLCTWAHVTSAADVRRELEAARARPRFADAAEVRRRVADRLQTALGDSAVARHVARLPLRIALRLHRPDCDMVIDLATTPAVVRTGLAAGAHDLVVYMSAVSADDWFAGRLDLPAALRRREVQTRAASTDLLRVASVLKAACPAYERLSGSRGG